MEPRFFENQLWIGGVPGTKKFEDLARDPRFTLQTATIDTHVSDGDAKVRGTVEDVMEEAPHQRYAEALFAETGFDLRGRPSSTSSRRTSSVPPRSRSATSTWISGCGARATANASCVSTDLAEDL